MQEMLNQFNKGQFGQQQQRQQPGMRMPNQQLANDDEEDSSSSSDSDEEMDIKTNARGLLGNQYSNMMMGTNYVKDQTDLTNVWDTANYKK